MGILGLVVGIYQIKDCFIYRDPYKMDQWYEIAFHVKKILISPQNVPISVPKCAQLATRIDANINTLSAKKKTKKTLPILL